MENKELDEILAEKAQNGDENAETELLYRYKDLVTKISRYYFVVGGDIEDLNQEGMIGLYKAIQKYSKGRDASFKTFAILCIKRQMMNEIKRSHAKKNAMLTTAVSFQDFVNQEANDNFDCIPMELICEEAPDEKVINRERYQQLTKKIKSILSPHEFKVFEYYLKGFSYKEISSMLNVSNKSIDNSLTRIKSKLKKHLDIA